jgi:hypothetical protein
MSRKITVPARTILDATAHRRRIVQHHLVVGEDAGAAAVGTGREYPALVSPARRRASGSGRRFAGPACCA